MHKSEFTLTPTRDFAVYRSEFLLIIVYLGYVYFYASTT